MRLVIPQDDDPRYLRREPRRDPAPELPRKKPEPMVEPGPLDRRAVELANRAAQNRFPEIPRRRYEPKPVPDDQQLAREPADRHVRSLIDGERIEVNGTVGTVRRLAQSNGKSAPVRK